MNQQALGSNPSVGTKFRCKSDDLSSPHTNGDILPQASGRPAVSYPTKDAHADQDRRATRSISTSAPHARPVTPTQVRAGRRSGGK